MRRPLNWLVPDDVIQAVRLAAIRNGRSGAKELTDTLITKYEQELAEIRGRRSSDGTPASS